MLWAFYGLIHSLARAAFTETGRVFGVDAWHLTFWHAFFAVVILVPLMPFMAWPADGHFYFAAAIVALMTTVGTVMHLSLSAQKSGRVSSIYMPLEAIAACLIWILIVPDVFQAHVDDLWMSAVVVLALLLSTAALLRIRPSDINWTTFSVVAPVGVTYAVAGVVTKIVMPEENVLPVALSYVLVSYVVMACAMGVVLLLKKKAGPDLMKTDLIRAGLLTGVFSGMAYATFVSSVALAPNPGYTSAMAMLLPVWLVVLHKITGVKDQANPLAALLIAFSLFVLVMVVS